MAPIKMHTELYILIYTCLEVLTHMHTHTHACTHTYTHTHTHTHTHAPLNKRPLIFTHIGLHHLNVHTQKHVELYSYAKLYAHTSSIPFFIETRRLYKFRVFRLRKLLCRPTGFIDAKSHSCATKKTVITPVQVSVYLFW